MMFSFTRLTAAFAIVCAALAPLTLCAQPDVLVSSNSTTSTIDANTMRARANNIDALITTLNAQIKLSVPRTLSIDDNATWKEQTTWIISARDRFATHAKE